MRCLRCLVLLLAGVVVSALGSNAPAEPARVLTRPIPPSEATLAPLGLTKMWHAYVGVAGRGDHLVSVQVFGNQIVTQTRGGTLSCLDAETGANQWTVRRTDHVAPLHFPLAANSYIFACYVGGKILGYDRINGMQEWVLEVPGVLSTFPALDDGHLYIATSDGRMHSYLLPMPKRQVAEAIATRGTPTGTGYGMPGPATLKAPYFIWSFRMESPAQEPPASFPNHIVFADGAGQLFSFENEKRRLADRSAVAAPIVAPLTAAGDYFFVASRDHSVMSFEIMAGGLAPRWRFLTSSPIDRQPMVVGPDVFVVGTLDGLYSLDRVSGSPRWRLRRASQFLAASQRLVFARDEAKRLLAIDRQRGVILAEWNASEFAHMISNADTDRLVLANDDGLVMCLRDRDPAAAKPTDYRQPFESKGPAPKPQAKPDDDNGEPKMDDPDRDPS
ncbi:MAG TPA: PQQ-binding-like beta-propeller repeat protein [Gemmatales bacterium]|nr:PQQ-binding-like beta-propeller repeat protein [Gemmatales bacterium]HMP59394.1 PQQ-binding-like beta-propeller repeat protein [Gemmatales bacterium]